MNDDERLDHIEAMADTQHELQAEGQARWAYGFLENMQGSVMHGSGAIRTILDYVRQPIHRCDVCSNLIHWVNCPTGGWWSHFKHVSDYHEPIAGGPILCETEEG